VAKIDVKCPGCQGINVVKSGLTGEGKQRYRCHNDACNKKTFILNYSYKGRLPEVKQKIVEMALNGSGVRDTVRVLGVGINTVIRELKKNKA
jgi:transposase-like protein